MTPNQILISNKVPPEYETWQLPVPDPADVEAAEKRGALFAPDEPKTPEQVIEEVRAQFGVRRRKKNTKATEPKPRSKRGKYEKRVQMEANVIDFIKQYKTDRGYYPTRDEIGEALGIAYRTVGVYIVALADEGKITITRNRPRGIRLVEAAP